MPPSRNDRYLHRITAEDLHATWTSDFANFTLATYKKTTGSTKKLRDLLRSHNVYIPKTGTSIGAQLIKSAAESWTPMPESQMHEVLEEYRPRIPLDRFPIQGSRTPSPKPDRPDSNLPPSNPAFDRFDRPDFGRPSTNPDFNRPPVTTNQINAFTALTKLYSDPQKCGISGQSFQ